MIMNSVDTNSSENTMTISLPKTYEASVIDILENGDALIELPQNLLDDAGLKEGDSLDIVEENGVIILRKVVV